MGEGGEHERSRRNRGVVIATRGEVIRLAKKPKKGGKKGNNKVC